METTLAILFVGLLVFLAHTFVALFNRTRIPDVLFLILIGLIIGPVLKIVTPEDFGRVGHVFIIVALVIILFEGGLQLSFESLRRSLRNVMVITILSYVLTLVVLTLGTLLLTGLPLQTSLFVGAILAGPAPAIVIPLVRQLKLEDTTRATLTLESALGEAICIVVSLGVLESIKLREVQVGLMTGRLLSAFLFAVIIGSLGGYVWSLLLNKIRQLQHAMFTTPASVFVIYGITELLGFSGPVAALAFGITIGNPGFLRIPLPAKLATLSPIHHDEAEKAFFGETVFLLKTFFFVYLGLSIKLSDFWSMGVALVLSSLLLLPRLVAVRLSTSPPLISRRDASLMAIFVPKGTAAAVLGSLMLQLGMENGPLIQNIIYGVVLLSILLTGSLIFLHEKEAMAPVYQRLFGKYGVGPLIDRGVGSELSKEDAPK